MADRANIRDRVQRNLDRVGVSTAENTDVNSWIDEVIREDLCADHNWSFMEASVSITLVSGTGSYAIPNASTHKDISWVQIRETATSDYQDVQEVSEEVIRDQRYFSELSTSYGLPKAWARSGANILFRPIPDAAYDNRIKVWEYPPALASEAATNAFTLYYPKLLIYGVTDYALDYYGETEKRALWTQRYRDELGKAISVDRRILNKSHLTLRPSGSAGRPVAGLRGFGWRRFWWPGNYGWYP